MDTSIYTLTVLLPLSLICLMQFSQSIRIRSRLLLISSSNIVVSHVDITHSGKFLNVLIRGTKGGKADFLHTTQSKHIDIYI